MKKIFLLVCLMAVGAFAGQKWWTASDSATNKNWNNAANWYPSGAPATTDSVYFGDSTLTAVAMDADKTIAKVTLSGGYHMSTSPAKTLTVNPGANITPVVINSGTFGNGIILDMAPGNSYTLPDILTPAQFYIRNGVAAQTKIHLSTAKVQSYMLLNAYAPALDTLWFDGDSIIAPTELWVGNSSWGGNGKTTNIFNDCILKIGALNFSDGTPTVGYTHKMGTSKWIVAGDYTYATNCNWDIQVGTSQVIFTGNGITTSCNENPSFYDFEVSGGTRTMADSLLCSGDVTVSGGTLKVIGKTVRCVDYTIASGATINDTNSQIYVSGNISFGATSTRTTGSGKYTLSTSQTHTFALGNGTVFDTIRALGSTTFSGTATMCLQMGTPMKISGGVLTLTTGYDIQGGEGDLDSLDGVKLNIPADDSIDVVYFKDVTLDAADTLWLGINSIDGGGNSGNIIFPVLDTVPIISGIDDSLVYFGDTVTISGTIFGAAPTLYVDGGVVPTISVSATEIVFRTTDLSQGLKLLVVKNNTYNTFDTSTLYYNQIVIDSIRPEHGTVGDTLSVYGVFVASEPSVKIGDSVIGAFVARTDSLCSFRAVPGYVGQVAVIVYRGGLGYADTIRFDYDTIPVLASASPMFSKLAPPAGYLDTIIGTGMDQIDTVFYGDSIMINPKSRSYTMWIDTINGYHVRGWQDFISVSQYGYRDTLIGAINFKNLHITSLTPSSGKIGDTITMRAIWGFKTSGLAVKIDTASATVIAGYTDTLARIIAPVNPRGYNKTVEVVNSDNDTTYSAWSYPFDNQGGGRGGSTSGRGLMIDTE